mmetsp:Transcript_27269/g.37945  ORF Transcript_27269/g.37945 Transcript_27269/m.37945 type:complete len:916 (-) Transcript_27269:142-2889(-)|eukprot:CAMPEP_0184479086 /NCGR_PEP_ID=MMETSP0113_2-20130426/935_1 /TAXON_ID=91329 /ORGANISM="Norrisiella sphaerica, Strain BC52" /LENGTH=915 /DNA_ID=CAMNT_0026857083 /DNA_START=362 /DNA_END=3109 /DNA_ORIENTATION=-
MQADYKLAPTEERDNVDAPIEGSHNQLGLINGVVVPCSLNILGVVLFLWLPWAIGQAGAADLIGMFILGEAQTLLTVLSLSAIISNGTMKGGGSYFMISRSLGPELGGAMGFLFYISYAVSATFYAAGFGKEVQQTFFTDMENAWGGFFLTLCSSAALLMVLIVALIGAQLFTKINVLLFLLQFASIFIALGTVYFGHPKESENGWESSVLRDNWSRGYNNNSACGGQCTFQKVFAIIFPAVTGIMEGANLSGDLKNPGKDIGRGTLMAVFTAFIIYILLIIGFGGAFSRDVLINNEAIFQEACVNEYIVVVGILVSTASSALGAIFGGSRILQALARDEIFPGIKWAGKGTLKGDEPWVAVLVTWGIAQACMFIGGLDAIAPIISTFFCLSYACCNLACLLVSISGTPNFRPRFKYFSWHTCLLGLILNIFVMFFLNVYYATASLVIMLAIFAYLLYKAPQTSWGDVRQALIYHQVRKYLLRLDSRLQHGKTWRPSVLLLVDSLNGPLVEFCNLLKKGGLYVIGNVVLGARFDRLTDTASRMKTALATYIYTENLKAFPAVAVGSTARTAYQNLMVMSGLGAMTPNTVVLPYIENLHLKEEGANAKANSLETKFSEEKEASEIQVSPINDSHNRSKSQYFHDLSLKMERKDYSASKFFDTSVTNMHEFVNVIGDARALAKNVLVTRNFQKLGAERIASSKYIDVWLLDESCIQSWNSFERHVILILELAHVLLKNKVWGSQCIVRLLMPIRAQTDTEDIKVSTEKFVKTKDNPSPTNESAHAEEKALKNSLNGDAKVLEFKNEKVTQTRAMLQERLYQARFDNIEIEIIPIHEEDLLNDSGKGNAMAPSKLNRMIRERSSDTLLTLMPLPRIPANLKAAKDCEKYYQILGEVSHDLPPCALLSESDHRVMSREI